MTTFATLATDRRFVLLWLAMLVSATGTFLLLVTVSAQVLRSSGSGLAAAAVFASQWLLPVLLAPRLRHACEAADLRRPVVLAELASAACSLLVGLFLHLDLLAAVLLGFAARGLGEAVTKSARAVFVRLLFDGEQLAAASTTFNMSYYVGIALGGIAASLLVGRVSVGTVCVLDAATFLVSAGCYALLPPTGAPPRVEPRRGLWSGAWAMAARQPVLLRSLATLIAATGCFQGFHNAARTLLPIRHLGFSDAVAMQLQAVSGTAIICGALAVPLLQRLVRLRWFDLAVYGAACAALLGTAWVRSPAQLFAAYFGFMFLFEVSFTAAEAKLIQRARPEDIATLSVAAGSGGTALLVATALLTGALADAVDFEWVAGGVVVLALLLVAGTGLAGRRA